MLNLQQAIDLATEAHKGQFRRPKIVPYENIVTAIGGSTACDLEGGVYRDSELLRNETRYTYSDTKNTFYVEEPYITHPLAVMEMMTTEEEKIVAVLHDVIEDTDLEWNDLLRLKVPVHLIRVLERLTRNTYTTTYSEYISLISLDKLATKVKIADMFHNISDNCTDSMKKRYFKAIKYLLQD